MASPKRARPAKTGSSRAETTPSKADADIDEASAESFPASDPPARTATTGAQPQADGDPRKKSDASRDRA
jgi:hypothetical protein